MTPEPRPRSRTGSPSAQFALAALFLVLGVAWLLNPSPDAASHWVPALAWLLMASVWLVRGIRQVASPRAPRQR